MIIADLLATERTLTDTIRKRASAATPGPWGGAHVGVSITGGQLGYSGLGRQVQLWTVDDRGPLVTDSIAVCEVGLHRNDESNATFIAAARTDIPALCAQNERLIAALEVALKCSWCEGREDDCTACANSRKAVEAFLNPKGGV